MPSYSNEPVEANLFHHLKDAFKNPPEEPGKPRVLLIGDSISIGYTIPVRKQLQGKALVFRPPVNCQHTGYGLENLKSWLGSGKWDVIHFNWGIWDTHMLDAKGNLTTSEGGDIHVRYTHEQYRENLTKLVDILQGTGAKLIWAETTPVMCYVAARFDDLRIRNEIAAEIMRAHKIEIDDLYAFSLPHVAEWQMPDKCHFNPAGNEKLGEHVSSLILHALETPGFGLKISKNPRPKDVALPWPPKGRLVACPQRRQA